MVEINLAINSLADIVPPPLVLSAMGHMEHTDPAWTYASDEEIYSSNLPRWLIEVLPAERSVQRIPATWNQIDEGVMAPLPVQLQILTSPEVVAQYRQHSACVLPKDRTTSPLYANDDEAICGMRLEAFYVLLEILGKEPRLNRALAEALGWDGPEGARLILLFADLQVRDGELTMIETDEPLAKVFERVEAVHPRSLIVCLGDNWTDDVYLGTDQAGNDGWKIPNLGSSVAMVYGSFINSFWDRQDEGIELMALLPNGQRADYRHQLLGALDRMAKASNDEANE